MAIKEVKEGEQLTISLVNPLLPIRERIAYLKIRGYMCECSGCRNEVECLPPQVQKFDLTAFSKGNFTLAKADKLIKKYEELQSFLYESKVSRQILVPQEYQAGITYYLAFVDNLIKTEKNSRIVTEKAIYEYSKVF